MTADTRNLTGRRALVTGASSGIGRATARLLLERRAAVVATGRRADRLAELAGASTLAGDVTDAAFRDRLVAFAGEVDILVNAAGWARHAPLLEGVPDDWRRAWDINVHAVLCLTQALAQGMARRRAGHIVMLSSILAGRVYPNMAMYAATKHAIRALSDGLRVELHGRGIKVTEVAPGQTATEFFSNTDHPAVLEGLRNRPFPPLAPEQVAQAIVDAVCAPGNASIDRVSINPLGQS